MMGGISQIGSLLCAALPVGHANGTDCLVARDGRPVWPISSAEDEAALASLARLFGASLRWTEAIEGVSPQGQDTVASLGDEASCAATLYAHLTQRRCRRITSIKHVQDIDQLSIIVTTIDRLTPDLFVRLYDDVPNAVTVPGIVAAESTGALRRQVLIRSAASVLSGLPALRLTDILPICREQHEAKKDHLVLLDDASPAAIIEAMGNGSGVLRIVTHSDGVDAMLNPRLTLCPMDRSPSRSEDAPPYCAATGICHRHDMPVSEALASQLVVSPDALRAQIFLWDVCWGVMPKGRTVDPVWGLGRRMLNSATIGAMLTPWTLVVSGPNLTVPLAKALARGMPAGQAAAQFKASADAVDRSYRMAVFGDPHMRLPAADRNPSGPVMRRPPMPSRNRLWTRGEPSTPSDGLGFIGYYLEQAATHLEPHAVAGAEAATKELLSCLQSLLKDRPIEDATEAPGPHLRNAVLDFIFMHGSMLSKDWMAHVSAWHSAGPITCFACGETADRIVMEFSVPSVSPRDVTLCAICGLVRDAPVGLDLTIAHDRESATIRLSGDLPFTRWAADVALRADIRRDRPRNLRWQWPCDDAGHPAPYKLPVEARTRSHSRITVTYMHETALAIFSWPVRI
jgi:hypothetical protein